MGALANISRDNCRPALYPIIERVDVKGRTVVLARVEKRTGPPYENNSGQCFVRVGSSKRLASPQERARLLQQAGLYHFDETPVTGTSLEDLDRAAFRSYFEKISRQKIESVGILRVMKEHNGTEPEFALEGEETRRGPSPLVAKEE